MLSSGMVHGDRVGSMRRRVSTGEAAINDMQVETQRLREENARVRSELRGMDRGAAASRDETSGEPVSTPADSNAPRAARPYRSRSTFGERVRAFFSGREPAG